MDLFLASSNSGMTLMVIATSLCNRYNEWCTDSKIMDVVNVQTNTICIGLKQMYPLIEDKVAQSIALAFTMYFVITIQDNLRTLKTEQKLKQDNNQSNEENVFSLNSEYYRVD